ncbi:DNA cytosine methyltransferase [Martelella mediterranea]|uniref:DNA (cytosine-5-)-methyltransferase n=1 Tax=Martelella mediterranea DSM 17316 TaxID=1122214 RepID=A0A1U9Z2M2_9HYPH|nr:DNA cytosine methyltransferase [Martelella mediterranea]AQZ51947.1 putative BsuMI modification methylase subunit YdiO [Martelella mediterranea DSM 17316]
MINVVDFFCGCGGTSAGLRAAGMNIVAGIDIDAQAGQTYASNFPTARFLMKDIQTFDPSELQSILGGYQGKLLFAACAPCQPFTKQHTHKKVGDNRRQLLDHFHKFVRDLSPDYLLLENVPGLQKIASTDGPLGRFVALLKELKYSFDIKVISSQDYGVPQIRKRLVLIASKVGDIRVPVATHDGSEERPYLTVWDCIGDLPPIEAGGIHHSVPNHQAANLSDLNKERIRNTPINGGRMDWPADLGLRCHQGHSGHTDVYGRMSKDRPASALSTRCISLSNGRYGHPTQDRAISVREAARLQTFPDDFQFQGTLISMARQIGNAVPVKLAEAMGREVTRHLALTDNEAVENG